MILDKKAIEELSVNLSLKYIGIEQDWDIEFADSSRINEFILFYQQNDLSEEMKYALMSLILASYDDYLKESKEIDDNWLHITRILKSNIDLFSNLIYYWSGNIEDGDLFEISNIIRKI